MANKQQQGPFFLIAGGDWSGCVLIREPKPQGKLPTWFNLNRLSLDDLKSFQFSDTETTLLGADEYFVDQPTLKRLMIKEALA